MNCSGYSRSSLRLLVILLIDIALLSHHNPPAWMLPCLRPRMEVRHEQESFLIPCLAQRKPQSLQNLGSIITQINNNKHVTASFSPPKSSWVTFAWGYFIYFLSFPSPPCSPPSPLLLQTTLGCAPAGVWCWISISFQTDTEPEPEATANSDVQMLKVTLQSERNKNLLCFYKWGMACTWAFLQNPDRNKRDKTICLLWWWKTTMLCFSSSSVDAFTNREQWLSNSEYLCCLLPSTARQSFTLHTMQHVLWEALLWKP